MIHLPASVRVYLCLTACDMRKSFDGLHALVREHLAVLRSFVASCQRVGVDPFVWWKDILSRIADHPISQLAELLPHHWAPAQP